MDKSSRFYNAILKCLFYSPTGISLPELSISLNKSLPVVTQAVNELVNKGFIKESGVAPSTGGRRAAVFISNPERPYYIISVAMDQLFTRIAAYNMSQEVVAEIETLALQPLVDKDWLEKLIEFIHQYVDTLPINKDSVLGVGIGMPGFVNVDKGTNQSFYCPPGVNIRSYIGEQLGFKVYIENDSSLIALAEFKLGKAKGVADALIVNLGWGTGLGIIINGKQYRGHSGYAGEFSHIPLAESNKLCSCGKTGCLEVETSLLAMAERIKEEIAQGGMSQFLKLSKDQTRHEIDHLIEAARRGDPLVISVLSKAGYILGKGLATLLHILNPAKIILSGRGSLAGAIFLPSIQQALNVFCIHRIAEETTIEISILGIDAELLGALCCVVEKSSIIIE